MKKISKVQLLCCLVYFVSYITRIDYGAAIAEIVNDLQITKEAASFAVTGSFITYGLGQIVSGILGDKFKPRKLIMFGLIGTSLINLSMSFLPNIGWMNAVWCFNGFFQALMWPPLIRIMAENLDSEEMARGVKNVSVSSSVATIAIYLIVPAAIAVSGWRLAFIFAAACGIFTTLIWNKYTKGIKESLPVVNKKEESEHTLFTKNIIFMLIPIFLAIALQGILRDGITTWMPTYIFEVFNLDVSVSIMTAAALPIFSILSVNVATAFERKIGNPVKTAALLFGIGFISCAVMIPLFENSVLICSLLMAVITGSMHGVNLMLISRLPAYFSKYGKVSTMSGLLNACTYIGSAASTYGFAVLSEQNGWNFTVISWALIGLVGTALCIISIRPWKRFTEQ